MNERGVYEVWAEVGVRDTSSVNDDLTHKKNQIKSDTSIFNCRESAINF